MLLTGARRSFTPLRVVDKQPLSGDAVAIGLAVPQHWKGTAGFRHAPGQYLTVRKPGAGEDIRRCYSICSAPGVEPLRIGVKRVAGGRFSRFVVDELEPGMDIEVMPPQGRFTLTIDPHARNRYAAFAAGAGITPVLCMIHAALEGETASEFTLFYGNATGESVMFKDDLADLKDRFPSRFQLFHLLSREPLDVELLHGRLDQNRIQNFARLGLLHPAETDGFFLCGPGGMIETVRETLSRLGVPERRIHFEKFINAGVPITPARPAPPAHIPPGNAPAGARVQVIFDGVTRRFSMPAGAPNLIAAAAAAGIELPYSCKGGMCCTCRCKVMRGRVEMAVNYSLQPWELEAGFVLACQSRPTSKTLTLDFDSV